MIAEKILKDIYVAMKSGDKKRTAALRFLLSAIKRYETDNFLPGSKTHLTDEDCIKVIRRQIKERQESIAAYTKGNRNDLVDQEKQELAIIETYAPKQMDESTIRLIVAKNIDKGTKEFGLVMKSVMVELKGQADGGIVAKIVKEELNKIN